MSPEWRCVIATFEAQGLLIDRIAQVDDEGYLQLIGALAFLFRSEAACQR